MSVKCIPPLNPTFILKNGVAGVHLIFLFLIQNIHCGYSLESPQRGGSNVYPQGMFWAKIFRKIKKNPMNFSFFSSEKKKKNLCILHGQVLVMYCSLYFQHSRREWV